MYIRQAAGYTFLFVVGHLMALKPEQISKSIIVFL